MYNENDDIDFNVILWSDNKESSTFVENENKYTPGSIAPSSFKPWIPSQFYTINPVIPTPEPSVTLLCIIGFGMLMLKRKHPKWENG